MLLPSRFSTLKEEDRQKAGKDAFFKLMSKSTNACEMAAMLCERAFQEGDLAVKEADGSTNGSGIPTAREDLLSQQVRNLQVRRPTSLTIKDLLAGADRHAEAGQPDIR